MIMNLSKAYIITFGIFLVLALITSVNAENQNVSQENVTTNLSIITDPIVSNIILDDNDSAILGQLDPLPNTTFKVNCTADIDVDTVDTDLVAAWASIYHNTSSYSAGDDLRYHYTNDSCQLIDINGDNSARAVCDFKPIFYAWNGTWVCNLTVNDTNDLTGSGTGEAYMTELLAINVDNSDIDFGSLAVGQDTGSIDSSRVVWNEGNIDFGVKFNTWGSSIGDLDSMVCTSGSIDAEQLRVSSTGSVDWDSKIQIPSVGGSGTDLIPTFSIARQSSGTSPSSGTLYFGMGAHQEGTLGAFGGECSGNLMFTAIAD
jgi:hypothetical protein